MDYNWIWSYAACFGVCVLVTGVLIPQILLIAYRKNLFDIPDERKIHHVAVPRLGGIAFVPSIFLSLALCLGVNIALDNASLVDSFMNDALMLTSLFCGLQILYMVGIADDLVGVRYRAKFVAQAVVAAALIFSGVSFDTMDGLFGIDRFPFWIAMPFTMLAIVFLINSINLIDGIDGLASGLSSIAAVTYGVSFALRGESILALLAFSTLGVLVPFFYYNVFGDAARHGKIFMGDSGSLTVGLILTFLGIELFTLPSTGVLQRSYNCVLAYSPFVIPAFDVVRVYLFRLRNGKSPFLPDKNHIHHKLLALGMPQRHAMVTIVACSLALTLLNILLIHIIALTLTVILDIVLWTTVNVLIDRGIQAREQRLRDAQKPVPEK